MTTLTTDDLSHIAHLAKLTISQQENILLLDELNKILGMVEKMNAVNTDCIAALAHPYDEKQPLRPDEITETNQRQLFQSIAAQTQAGFYIVPTVIENNE